MYRSILTLLCATSLLACDSGPKPEAPKQAQAAAVKPAEPTTKPAEPAAAPPKTPDAPKSKDEIWQERLASRVLADSGLGEGGKFSPFDIVNCDTGEEYCQVCKFGSNPKIMAVGTLEDPAFKEDLKNIEALVAKYGEDKVKAFAVITDLQDGKAKTPAPEVADKAKALKAEMKLSMPVVVPARDEQAGNKIWEEYYNVTKSRTVMFSNGRNEVKYSAVAPTDLAKLDEAIKGTVAG